jgi:aryl-alcohol dehydrogenase-like predicted oxidoreductase
LIVKNLGSTGIEVSAIGQGASMGGYSTSGATYHDMVAIIRSSIDLGMSFIDTAPIYSGGDSETAVGKAIKGVRNQVCIATKIAPENLSSSGVVTSIDSSLRRLKTDTIDLIQIHWSNPNIPIAETMDALAGQIESGKIRAVGVSNFSLGELKEAQKTIYPYKIESFQGEYNLFNRSLEDDLIPYANQHQMTVIGYSPLHRGRIASGRLSIDTLTRISARHNKTNAQVALRWLVTRDSVVVIPNTSNPQRVLENAESGDFNLTDDEIKEIDQNCIVRPILVPTNSIQVSTDLSANVYRTIEEAKRNHLDMTPSPTELAEQITSGEFLKPVILVPSTRGSQ